MEGAYISLNTFHLKWIVLLPENQILGAFYDFSANQFSQPGPSFFNQGWIGYADKHAIHKWLSLFFYFLGLKTGHLKWKPLKPMPSISI